MKKPRKKSLLRIKSPEELGKMLGFSDLEVQLLKQKKDIVLKLRKAREDQGLSQAVVAGLIGSQQPAIARMESGLIGEISLDFLFKVAVALNVSITIGRKAA